MISKKMELMSKSSSAIREMFEVGAKLKKQFGEENVFDFSLGNPNVQAPKEVEEAILDVIKNEDPVKIHGYMNNAGFEETRQAVAENLNRRFETNFTAKNIIMTVGAASGMNIMLKTMLEPGDEVIAFAPFFGEYTSYVRNYDGELVVIPANTETFMPNLAVFREKISPKTKAVIINNPNNPTGVIYPESVIKEVVSIMEEKQKEYGTVIYLISDEPYRELVYDGSDVPYLTKYYDNTLVGYSYSKSLSLPGERIGYIVVPDESDNADEFISAVTMANRISGSVNAPSLMQLVIARCVDAKCDVDFYANNGKTLYDGMTEAGFECIKPQGAFYLWVKSPVPDEKKFIEAGKKYNILMVPGSAFGCPGYVRLSYCVSYRTIVNSIPKFKELAKEYF